MSDPSNGLGAIVVGTGFGFLTHMRALRQAGYEVHALVGRNPERTAERAQRAGIAHGLTSLDEALALPGVDVVSVATPPHTHASIVLPAIAAGKHVLCEKPFAKDAAEAKQMLDAAEAAGVVHLMGTEFRFATAQAVAARAIAEGAIGKPRLATFILHHPGLADPAGEVPEWWGDASQGGGWLGAYASHVIDQIRVSCGEFASVNASLQLLADRPWSAEDTFLVSFRTHDGVDGLMQSSAGDPGPPFGATRIAGESGTLWIEGADVKVSSPSGPRTIEVPDDLRSAAPAPPDSDLLVTAYDMLHSMGIDLDPFTKLFRGMAARIRGEKVAPDPALATFHDGLQIQKVLDAVRRSSAERREILID